MSDYDRKYQAALDELGQTGIWPSNYEPPATKVSRYFGRPARPPHYESFLKIFLSYGIWFGCAWGALMWVLSWRAEGIT